MAEKSQEVDSLVLGQAIDLTESHNCPVGFLVEIIIKHPLFTDYVEMTEQFQTAEQEINVQIKQRYQRTITQIELYARSLTHLQAEPQDFQAALLYSRLKKHSNI